MKSIIATLITICFLSACKTGIIVVENCVEISNPSSFSGEKGTFNILTIQVENDILYMDVEYRGQMTDRVFMHWNGMLMKSLPPKASVQIGFQKTHGNKLVKRSICFDITKLREKTRKQGLVIMIEGFDKLISIPAEK